MTKIKIDIQRRIENIGNNYPKVGKVAENHIDDNWTNDTLYRGEMFIDLDSNILYTSNGQYIVQLNTEKNYILSGLEVKKPTLSGDGIALDLDISSGYALFNGKLGYFQESGDSNVSEYQIDLSGTSIQDAKFCLLFAKLKDLAITEVQESQYNEIELHQHIITGRNDILDFSLVNNNQLDIINKLYNYIKPEILKEYILLSVIFIPANYNVSSFNLLEPISLSNKYASYPLQEKTANELLHSRINTISEWGTYKVYYKTQIVRSSNMLYVVHKTFGTGANANILDYLIPDYNGSEASDSASESNQLNGVLSKVNVDYTNPDYRIDGNSFWCKLSNNIKKPTDSENYKYIIGTVPNLHPSGIDVSTKDIPEVTVNGVRLTVAFEPTNISIAQVYFAKVNIYSTFDEDNYTLEELNNLDFSGRNIKEGYYLIWNEQNIDYEFESDFDIILHYKL